MLLLTTTVGSNGMFFKFSHSSLSYTTLVTVHAMTGEFCNQLSKMYSIFYFFTHFILYLHHWLRWHIYMFMPTSIYVSTAAKFRIMKTAMPCARISLHVI